MKVIKLKTGVHVISHTGADGITRYEALTQSQYNLHYKHNVWWSNFKNILTKLNINTKK